MTTEKFAAFMEKLLEKTKRGEIKWKRYSPTSFERWASETKSFSCVAGAMCVDMLSSEDFDSIYFNISYDKNVPTVSLTPDSDETSQIALRLATYVYNQFPNLEKCVDQFLNDL